MVSYRSTRLANGLRVITVEQPHLHSATATVMVGCGSRHERAGEWGLSHLLEHMLFRGSKHFANGRQLAHVFERAGGALQAATWRDHTSYTTSLHPSHLKTVLAALADMVVSPLLHELDLERNIVEEELQAELDEYGEDIDLGNVSRSSIWRKHPMGRRIIGTIDGLRAHTAADLRAYHGRHYNAHNAVICVAGRVQADHVEALIEDFFGPMPGGSKTVDGPAPRFAPSETLTSRRLPGSQVGLQLTFGALPDTHADFVALTLLSSILDDGLTSRLPHALCEREGLVYELSSGLDCYADCGLYDIEMQLAPGRASRAVATTLQVLRHLCREGITASELEAARQRHLHELEFRVDSTEELAQHFAVDALFDRRRSLEDDVRRLQAVGPADVQRVAHTLFSSGKVHGTLLGPVDRADMEAIENQVGEFASQGGLKL